MNLEDIRLLYDFNAWANNRTLDACAALTPEQLTRDLGSSFKSVRDTLAHIYGAQWIWLERWHGRIPSGLPSAADFPDLEVLRRRFAEIDRNLVDYAASLTSDDLQRAISYKTTAGSPQTQPLWQMLQHLANHGTYHRGQIAAMLRQLGTKASSTDLIGFYRERAAKAGA
ncbi:MAG: DinB family protein [Acidobacteriota bacterium]|nr:DinB family protein [Acidobacteriota bacterium]MDE3170996.1 DinB family protein [Acidobacteriota bacterium]